MVNRRTEDWCTFYIESAMEHSRRVCNSYCWYCFNELLKCPAWSHLQIPSWYAFGNYTSIHLFLGKWSCYWNTYDSFQWNSVCFIDWLVYVRWYQLSYRTNCFRTLVFLPWFYSYVAILVSSILLILLLLILLIQMRVCIILLLLDWMLLIPMSSMLCNITGLSTLIMLIHQIILKREFHSGLLMKLSYLVYSVFLSDE